jgi:cytochrome P450
MSAAQLRSYPLVGHTPAFLRDRLGLLEAAAEGADRAVELSIGGRTYLLVDAAEVKHVLVDRPEAYTKTPRLVGRAGRRLAGENLLTATGARHRAHRLALQPAFTAKAIEARAGTVPLEAALERVARWRLGSTIDVAAEMEAIARRVVMRTLLGRLPRVDEERLDEAIVRRRRHIEAVFRVPVPAADLLPTRVNLLYRKHRPVFAELVSRRLRDLGGGAPDESLLAALAEAVAHEGERAGALVLDEVVMLLVTGHETVADVLAWTWHLLATHPRVEARLREELHAVLGDRDPEPDDVVSLPYTGRVLAESLRLYPPTWLFVRMALVDDELPTDVAVPRGSKLYLSPWVLHRNARYFPEPLRFDPDRFRPETARSRPRHAYFPFGSGPRVCIGEALARLELATIVAAVARRYRLVAGAGAPVPEPGITLRPRGGLPMRIEAVPPA